MIVEEAGAPNHTRLPRARGAAVPGPAAGVGPVDHDDGPTSLCFFNLQSGFQ